MTAQIPDLADLYGVCTIPSGKRESVGCALETRFGFWFLWYAVA